MGAPLAIDVADFMPLKIFGILQQYVL